MTERDSKIQSTLTDSGFFSTDGVIFGSDRDGLYIKEGSLKAILKNKVGDSDINRASATKILNHPKTVL
jgi:hypothetical protein